jgi:hypothetical protein
MAEKLVDLQVLQMKIEYKKWLINLATKQQQQ